jgi:hypothetical protein
VTIYTEPYEDGYLIISLRRLGLALLMVMLLIPVTPGAQAAEKSEKISSKIAQKGQIKPKKSPVRVELFQPEPTNEVAVDRVEVNWFENGTAEVVVQGHLAPGQAVSYDLVVDPKRKTFSTKSKSPHMKSGLDGDISILATSYTRFVMITTHDPAEVPLAETRDRLTWYVNDSGAVYDTITLSDCSAWNPTSLGTHWFISSCIGNESYTSSQAYSYIEGDYYNYDGPPIFGNDNLPTYVTHRLDLYGSANGSFTYTYSYPVTGEYYWLLHNHVTVS